MNPLMVVLVIGFVLIGMMVAGLVMVKSSVEAWLRGEEFQTMLVEKVSALLRSEVELVDLNWQGGEAYSDRFDARGYEDAAFSRITLDGVRGELGGIRDGAFRVPRVTVNRFGLLFSDQRLERPSGAEATAPSDASGLKVPDWLARFIPNRVEVDEVVLSSATVTVKNPDGSIPFEMQGVSGLVVPDFETMMWEIRGKGGKLVVPNQPKIRVQETAMRWKETDLFIDRASLGIFENGHVDGSGEISFAGNGNFDLDLLISAVEVDELIEGEWEERLNGIIEGPVQIVGRPGEFVYEGSITVSEAVIEKIPVLTVIAKYTRNEQFKHLVLSEAVTDFKSDGKRVELRNLALQADGLVRVEGEVDIEGEVIDGRLQVGVAPGTLRWIPGAERQVFVENRDGFLWTSMRLTGPIASPQEDLSGRLIAAAGEAILKELPEGLLNEAQKFLDPGGATETPGSVIEQGKEILDALSPFLKGL